MPRQNTQCFGYIGFIFETEIQFDLPAIMPERLNANAISQPNPRNFMVMDRYKNIL